MNTPHEMEKNDYFTLVRCSVLKYNSAKMTDSVDLIDPQCLHRCTEPSCSTICGVKGSGALLPRLPSSNLLPPEGHNCPSPSTFSLDQKYAYFLYRFFFNGSPSLWQNYQNRKSILCQSILANFDSL